MPKKTSACLRVAGVDLRQDLGRDDARRIAHPIDVDIRVLGAERLPQGLELFGFERRVDGERRIGHGRIAGEADGEQPGGGDAPETLGESSTEFVFHGYVSPCD